MISRFPPVPWNVLFLAITRLVKLEFNVSIRLTISFSCILCPSDFLMIEIIYDHRMSLRDSAIRHFIIQEGGTQCFGLG